MVVTTVGVCRYSEGAVKHIRVESDMFLFADISISCVRIILVYIWHLAPVSFSLRVIEVVDFVDCFGKMIYI